MFREMRRRPQALSHEEIVDLLKKETRGVMSVQGDDGYPYGVPINHYYNEEDSGAASCMIKLPLGKTDIEYCYAFDLSTSIWWVWTVYKQSLEKLSDVLKELKVL